MYVNVLLSTSYVANLVRVRGIRYLSEAKQSWTSDCLSAFSVHAYREHRDPEAPFDPHAKYATRPNRIRSRKEACSTSHPN